ncbi:hypothetical protein S245_004484, partial [Arachis hypogaea]
VFPSLWLVRATVEAFRVADAPAKVFFLLMENNEEILPFCTQILQFQAQWPLYANSLLAMIRTLLEQSRIDEIRILSCNTLVNFIECQRYAIPLKSICVEVNFGGKNGTYVFNLEGFILKLCQLAQEVGKDERALYLRSVGLQALSYMVRFMGEHSHLSMDFAD